MANLTLIYGLRLLPEGEVVEIKDATLKLSNGHQAHVTMHLIEGSRQEIETRAQAQPGCLLRLLSGNLSPACGASVAPSQSQSANAGRSPNR